MIGGYYIGMKVVINDNPLPSYIQCRAHYTDIYAGKVDTVIGITTSGDKLAIRFDERVFTTPGTSSHDSGCLGKGPIGYCWYLPKRNLDQVITPLDVKGMQDKMTLNAIMQSAKDRYSIANRYSNECTNQHCVSEENRVIYAYL